MKRNFLFFFMLMMLAVPMIAQSWLQRANIPFAIQNSEGTSFTIDDKVYIVCGVENNLNSNFCWEFNTTNNLWTQKSSFPGCPRRWPNSFTINGKGYFFGGEDTISGGTNDLWEYDPIGDSWLQKSSLPDTVRGGAVSFSINNKGYIVGGAYVFGVVMNDCWEYDPLTDLWQAKSSMPASGRVWGAGFSLLGKGYVGLGSNYASSLKDWWEYDPSIDTWTIRDSFPCPTMESSSFSIGNYGYVGPAYYGAINPYSFFRYDPANDQWLQLTNFPGTQFAECYATSTATNGYIISGNSSTACVNTTWEYSPAVGIEELNVHSISVFPNPAFEEIVFSSPQFTCELNVRVLSLTGHVILTQTIFPNNNRFTLSRNALRPGYYFLEVIDEEGEISRIKFAFL